MKVTFAAHASMKPGVSACLLGLSALCSAGVAAGALALSPHDKQQAAQECARLLARAQVHRALQLVKLQLQSQGLKLELQGCPFVRTGAAQMQQVLDVRVWVTDSDVAANYVRGPLADDEPVDMGDVQLALPRSTQEADSAEDVSPDVLFNRNWLARVMQAQGLQNVHRHWWAFVPVLKRST